MGPRDRTSSVPVVRAHKTKAIIQNGGVHLPFRHPVPPGSGGNGARLR